MFIPEWSEERLTAGPFHTQFACEVEPVEVGRPFWEPGSCRPTWLSLQFCPCISTAYCPPPLLLTLSKVSNTEAFVTPGVVLPARSRKRKAGMWETPGTRDRDSQGEEERKNKRWKNPVTNRRGPGWCRAQLQQISKQSSAAWKGGQASGKEC